MSSRKKFTPALRAYLADPNRRKQARLPQLTKPPAFGELLVLMGVRDAAAASGRPEVSPDVVFAMIGGGLKVNYRGEAFAFDRAAFNSAVAAIGDGGRKLLTKSTTRGRGQPSTIRLTPKGADAVSRFPEPIGTALTELQILLRHTRPYAEALDKRRAEARAKVESDLTRTVAGAFIAAIGAEIAKHKSDGPSPIAHPPPAPTP